MKYDLVLGGGGARGFYHMGVVKAIQELDIEITKVAGCSIGALVGLIYADDPIRDIDSIGESINFMNLFRLSKERSGFLSADKIKKFFENTITARNFEDLIVPLRINALDINTGEEVVFEKGEIFTPLMASMAIPGVFPPVEYKGRLLCDAGMINMIPESMAQEPYIISDINFPLKKITKKSTKFEVLKNYLLIAHRNSAKEIMKEHKHSLHLRYRGDVGIFDFRKKMLLPLIKEGHETMKKEYSQLKNK